MSEIAENGRHSQIGVGISVVPMALQARWFQWEFHSEIQKVQSTAFPWKWLQPLVCLAQYSGDR